MITAAAEPEPELSQDEAAASSCHQLLPRNLNSLLTVAGAGAGAV